LGAGQLAAMSVEQLNALSQEQLGAFNAGQLTRMPAATLQVIRVKNPTNKPCSRNRDAAANLHTREMRSVTWPS
jgi:hypothetical protein